MATCGSLSWWPVTLQCTLCVVVSYPVVSGAVIGLGWFDGRVTSCLLPGSSEVAVQVRWHGTRQGVRLHVVGRLAMLAYMTCCPQQPWSVPLSRRRLSRTLPPPLPSSPPCGHLTVHAFSPASRSVFIACLIVDHHHHQPCTQRQLESDSLIIWFCLMRRFVKRVLNSPLFGYV